MKPLSKSEQEVVYLLSQDKSACEIAALRFRSTFTVQRQINCAKRKYEVNTAHGLTAKFVRLSLLVLLIILLLQMLTHSTRTTLIQFPRQYTHSNIYIS